MSPTPVAVVGRLPKILDKVREDLLPEYDAIHMVNDVDKAVKDLPLLLSNPPKAPEDSAANPGSQNYGERPRIVAVGGAFDDAAFKQMRDACRDVDKDVFWIRADTTRMESMPSLSDTEAFGAAMAKRAKAKLNELGVGSGTAKSTGETYYY